MELHELQTMATEVVAETLSPNVEVEVREYPLSFGSRPVLELVATLRGSCLVTLPDALLATDIPADEVRKMLGWAVAVTGSHLQQLLTTEVAAWHRGKE